MDNDEEFGDELREHSENKEKQARAVGNPFPNDIQQKLQSVFWSLSLKFFLATYGPAIAILLTTAFTWGRWVTEETILGQEWRTRGPRFTPQEAVSMEARLEKKIDALPTDEWRKRIETLEERAVEQNVLIVKTAMLLEDIQNRLVKMEDKIDVIKTNGSAP